MHFDGQNHLKAAPPRVASGCTTMDAVITSYDPGYLVEVFGASDVLKGIVPSMLMRSLLPS